MPPSVTPIARPLRRQIRLGSHRHRCYHSPASPLPPPFPPPQAAVLTAALPFIRHHGFSAQALAHGCAAAGYPPAAAAAFFPRGAFDLVVFHLARRRAELQTRWREGEREGEREGRSTDVERRLRDLIVLRLQANLEDGVAGRWNEALAVMALPSHLRASLHELTLLADEICHLADDALVDGRWYARRAAVSAVYASAELYMGGLAASRTSTEPMESGTSSGREDTAPARSEAYTEQRATADQKLMAETAQFVDRRVEEWRSAKGAVGSLGEWLGFNAGESMALMRSWGWRI